MLVRSVKVVKLQSRWPGCHDEIPFSFTHIHSSCAALPVRTRIHIFTSFLERKVFKDYKWRKAAKKTVYLSCTYILHILILQIFECGRYMLLSFISLNMAASVCVCSIPVVIFSTPSVWLSKLLFVTNSLWLWQTRATVVRPLLSEFG